MKKLAFPFFGFEKETSPFFHLEEQVLRHNGEHNLVSLDKIDVLSFRRAVAKDFAVQMIQCPFNEHLSGLAGEPVCMLDGECEEDYNEESGEVYLLQKWGDVKEPIYSILAAILETKGCKPDDIDRLGPGMSIAWLMDDYLSKELENGNLNELLLSFTSVNEGV